MVKIVDLLQNARDNVFVEMFSADVSAYFAEKSTVEVFVLPIPHSPARKLNLLRMFAIPASFEEAAPVIAPTTLQHRLMP